MSTCSVDECERPTTAKGLCKRHWERAARYGSPTAPFRKVPAPVWQAWARDVAASEPDGLCREWPFGRGGDYVSVIWDGQQTRLGRVMLMLVGQLPPSTRHEALHSCDNPPCAAPWHLRWGTREENMADMVERGRSLRGTKSPNAKLNEAKVVEIRRLAADGVGSTELGRRFGVSESTIRDVVRRRLWAWLDDPAADLVVRETETPDE